MMKSEVKKWNRDLKDLEQQTSRLYNGVKTTRCRNEETLRIGTGEAAAGQEAHHSISNTWWYCSYFTCSFYSAMSCLRTKKFINTTV